MMASKLCDSCKSATAALFCRPDSAFLCLNCDSKIHAANKLASRHPRVWVCEVCEQAPAHVTCKADAAALCVSCDRDIHSANPLARRHERLPVVPFYDSSHSHSLHHNHNNSTTPVNFLLDDRYFADADGGGGGGGGGGDVSREEAEAASWLLPNPPPPHHQHQHQHQQKVFSSESPDLNSGQYVFSSEMDPYLDLEYGPTVDPKLEAQEQNSSGTDGVVPVQSKSTQAPFDEEEEEDYHLDFAAAAAGGGSKPCYNSHHLYSHHRHGYKYNHPSAGLSHSVSSSSLEVGVVPDGSAMADVSNPYGNNNSSGGRAESATVQLSAVDREARVLRYREKRKNRKFEKTIRYASRKAYAETRPRIKGRFAKRSDINEEVDVVDRTTGSTSSNSIYAAFGVVPSF